MGKQNSKLKPEVLEDLKQNTEFTGKKYNMHGRLWVNFFLRTLVLHNKERKFGQFTQSAHENATFHFFRVLLFKTTTKPKFSFGPMTRTYLKFHILGTTCRSVVLSNIELILLMFCEHTYFLMFGAFQF